MNITPEDYKFMARAIQLAEKGKYTTHPNPRVGCVIVKDNQIVGEGFHQKAGEPHAEINAINSATASSVTASLQGATVYVTLEPCSHTGKTPPCANTLIQQKIKRVVIGMQDPNPEVAGKGIQKLRDAGLAVEVGVLENQAELLNPGFIKRMKKGLPWVRIKLAMSIDGRTAMASGESQWITGSAARNDVQRLRAMADAIMTGSGTLLQDDPSLNVRTSAEALGISNELKDKLKQPLCVLLDSQLQISPNAKMLGFDNRKTLIYTNSENDSKKEQLEKTGAKVITLSNDTERLSLKDVLQDLAKQQINEIHVEAGATLCGALLEQQLVDEIIIFMAPTLMGSNARGLFNLPELNQMKDKFDIKIEDIRAIGNDWRITMKPVY